MDVLHSLRASTDLIRLEVKDAPTGTEEEEEESNCLLSSETSSITQLFVIRPTPCSSLIPGLQAALRRTPEPAYSEIHSDIAAFSEVNNINNTFILYSVFQVKKQKYKNNTLKILRQKIMRTKDAVCDAAKCDGIML